MNVETKAMGVRRHAKAILVAGVATMAFAGLLMAPQGAEARTLSAGQTVRAQGDETFTVRAPARGYVYFKTTVLDEGSIAGNLWSETRLAEYSDFAIMGYGEGEYQTVKVSAAPGEIIGLRISDWSDNPHYKVTAVSVTNSAFELEPNDSIEEAENIPLDSVRTGIADEFNDDWFSYRAKQKGYYTATLRMKDDGSVNFDAYRGDEEMGSSIARYGDSWVDGDAVPLRAGQNINLRVSNRVEVNPLYELKLSYSPIQKPAAVTLRTVKSTGKRKLFAKWTESADADGYQVRYSRYPSMLGAKKRKVEAGYWGNDSLKTTIGKLSSKKTYYVQVRAYKYNEDFDEDEWSGWSNMKSVKVK